MGLRIGRIEFRPGPSVDVQVRAARTAHDIAARELDEARREAAQLKEEMLRSRRRIARLDPAAPVDEYDGGAWHDYWQERGED